jgi:hypothetical protein
LPLLPEELLPEEVLLEELPPDVEPDDDPDDDEVGERPLDPPPPGVDPQANDALRDSDTTETVSLDMVETFSSV